MHNNYIINNTYVWSSVRCEISSSFSLPKISNHSFLTDSPQRVSSRRSMFWSRSMSETRCAKRGTTTAWTRFHKVCLSWIEEKKSLQWFSNKYRIILYIKLHITQDRTTHLKVPPSCKASMFEASLKTQLLLMDEKVLPSWVTNNEWRCRFTTCRNSPDKFR